MSTETGQREALAQLGSATADAVARTLEVFAAGRIACGEPTVAGSTAAAFANLVPGNVAASVHYVDGVTGANILLLSPAGARALAEAMGVPPAEDPAEALSELEISAVGEAANQMLAAAAAAISVVIGQEIEISPPDVGLLENPSEAENLFGTAPCVCFTPFTIDDHPCRLVQLVPNAFVVRMARALDEMSLADRSAAPEPPSSGEDAAGGPDGVTEALGGISLRVWAELGRAQLGLGEALELPAGAVLELDRGSEAPVDLIVNGLCFGTGRLLVTEDGEWAIEVATVGHPHTRIQRTLEPLGK